jgi:hypothetical protein
MSGRVALGSSESVGDPRFLIERGEGVGGLTEVWTRVDAR